MLGVNVIGAPGCSLLVSNNGGHSFSQIPLDSRAARASAIAIGNRVVVVGNDGVKVYDN